ncbi:MAG TPA: hypothetical protein VG297_13590 [Bryobacteraceae bacterium]|jgi:hypothetical protein|nr:hypothetical protein [Bryobacteraceae bacterium]
MAVLTQPGTGKVRICRAFADQIDDCPMGLPPLKMSNVQFRRFFAAQPAPQEDSEQCSISLALERIRVRHLPELFGLVDGEPVTKTNAELLWPLDPPDAGCKIRAEKAGISGLVCKPTYGREPAINCARRELP